MAVGAKKEEDLGMKNEKGERNMEENYITKKMGEKGLLNASFLVINS